MFDGITIKCKIENFELWKRNVNLSFFTNVETETGEIKTRKRNYQIITTYRSKWETFDLIIKEALNNITKERKFFLTIRGSLHKNHHCGTNYLPFSWAQLQTQINHLSKNLHISPTSAQISTLELGVNIETPFHVTSFLRQNIISYKGYPFNWYTRDANDFSLGIYCPLSQYVIKIYDKGLQNNLPQNLMRFEIKFKRMQQLNKKGIKKLSDLQTRTKVDGLLTFLMDAWKNVLMFDIIHNVNTLPLKPKQIKLLNEGQNPKFWEQLKADDANNFKYERKKFKSIVAKYGNNSQLKISELVKNEWKLLINNYPDLPVGKKDLASNNYPNLPVGKKNLASNNLPEFTIKIKGKKEEKIKTDPHESNSISHSPNLFRKPELESWDLDIKELEKYFEKIKLPNQPIKLNQCNTITNISVFLNSHFSTVKANNGKKIFLPYLYRLKELKQYLIANLK